MKKLKFSSWLKIFVTSHPWWIIFLSLLVISSLGTGIIKMNFDNSYQVYFGEENPQLQAFNAMQTTYNKMDHLIFVIAPSEEDVFSKKILDVIINLTKDA